VNSEERIPPEEVAHQTSPMDVDYYPPPPPPLIDSQGNRRWIVEKLLDKKVQRVGRHNAAVYRVRWRGYPPSADTWEPEGTLLCDVPDLVADYDRQQHHA
jgi:hypothetical protein